MNERETKMGRLLDMIAATRDDEIACDDCLDELARLVEAELAVRASEEGFEAVRQHLKTCGECREEFETIRMAIEALGEAG